jgi:hypothetical protein
MARVDSGGIVHCLRLSNLVGPQAVNAAQAAANALESKSFRPIPIVRPLTVPQSQDGTMPERH